MRYFLKILQFHSHFFSFFFVVVLFDVLYMSSVPHTDCLELLGPGGLCVPRLHTYSIQCVACRFSPLLTKKPIGVQGETDPSGVMFPYIPPPAGRGSQTGQQ